MASVTIKDLPTRLHEQLKSNAKAHRRSLNSEVISILEASVEHRRMTVDEILAAAQAARGQVKRELTDQEINRFKRQGRL
jgi:Arc-like DNA binding domain.